MFILTKLLGNTYQAKILEALIENYDEEFTIPEIIEVSETSRGSAYSYIKSLFSQEIVVETRKIGGTQLYQLNLENPAIKALILLEHNLVTSELKKEITEEEVKKKSPQKLLLETRLQQSLKSDMRRHYQKIVSEISHPQHIRGTTVHYNKSSERPIEKYEEIVIGKIIDKDRKAVPVTYKKLIPADLKGDIEWKIKRKEKN